MTNLGCVVLAVFFLVDGGGAVEAASCQGLNLGFYRRPGIPLEQLPRPLRKTEQRPAPKRLSILPQTEVIAIA